MPGGISTLNQRRCPSRSIGRRWSSWTCGAASVDKKFVNASAFALAGAVLTFFSFTPGEALSIAVTSTVAVAYGIVVVFLYALSC